VKRKGGHQDYESTTESLKISRNKTTYSMFKMRSRERVTGKELVWALDPGLPVDEKLYRNQPPSQCEYGHRTVLLERAALNPGKRIKARRRKV